VGAAGYKFMLSNSDCADMFFDDLYLHYIIDRVWASRSVNANASKRGKLTEILVHNYKATKKHQLVTI
jgi:DNA adenine methylase